MHYQHSFHAGNFADVFKHLLLVLLLDVMSAKPKPWCFIDTHAGAGAYGLDTDPQIPGEWVSGIGRVWRAMPRDMALDRYLALVHSLAGNGTQPGRYPGSSWFAARIARPGDALLASESVPEVAAQLRHSVPEAAVQVRDGYEMASLLPPAQRRGVVLIDPPFERADEFAAAQAFIRRAAPRFAGGVFALWYPLKNPHQADHTLRGLARDGHRPVLDLRLDVGSRGDGKMHACGLAVMNPPYGFAERAAPAIQEVAHWLAPEAQAQLHDVVAA
ncbi:MAG TPA: 23S rRNA (adenine(2030)-N(6))-methyltransferase RlmJ [Nevskiaceae bacterium]|nr:23S rRNA (adenine(2030)-N(6))-methyltransferase RlmJ [Nevskiaceae bacterium]